MPPISYELINHFKGLQPFLHPLGLEAWVDVVDLTLTVASRSARTTLLPQFTLPVGEAVVYSPSFSSKVKRFIGWKPYAPRRWLISDQKLEFKQFVAQHDLLTPPWWGRIEAAEGPFVVKRNMSSFSEGIEGPYAESREVDKALQEGEYAERYISGHIIKIWYWSARPVAIEETEMLSVVGDGVSSIRQLIERHVYMLGISEHSSQQYESFLRFQKCDLYTVLNSGEKLAIEFRYNSELPTLRMRDLMVGHDSFYGLEPLLWRIGQVLHSAIPNDYKADAMYSVDAMLDEKKQLWLLEMNSNPYVHPFLYQPLLRHLQTVLR